MLYYARDHLGSIRDVLGTLPPLNELINLASYDYGPYGEQLDQGRGRRAGSAAGLGTGNSVDGMGDGAGLEPEGAADGQGMEGAATGPGDGAAPEALPRRHGAIQSTLGYAGMFYHARSGLYLTHYRAYDPRLGRWLSRDPIWEAGGVNLYGYVGGDPIEYSDPIGLLTLYSGTSGGAAFGPLGITGGEGSYVTTKGEGGFYTFNGTEMGGILDAGWNAGFQTGNSCDFKDKSNYVTLDVIFFSISGVWNSTSWGVNIGAGIGLGLGWGETTTQIYPR